MKKMNFQTPYNYKGVTVSVINGISETEPDMALSIRTILERYVRGIAPPVNMRGTYEDDVDIDTEPINPIDITEIVEEHRILTQKLINDEKQSKQRLGDNPQGNHDGSPPANPSDSPSGSSEQGS